MSRFLTDRPHLWHGNLKKLILTVGLLCLLAISEIKAQTDHSLTPAHAERVCKQTYKRMHISECQPCTYKGPSPCYPGSVEAYIQQCPYVGNGFKTCRIACREEYTTENCCLGFWGDGCTQECPGGSRNPCNGHGKCCSKNGQCNCKAGFKGAACELCTNETKSWPNCSLEAAMSASTEVGMTTPAQPERFCRQTYQRSYQTDCRPCSSRGSACPAGYNLGPWQFTGCSDTLPCRFVCREEYTPVYCCHGYWGDGCVQECPGGSRNPCNGHGECNRKNGQCYCQPGFEGTACELCTDVTKYGPNCSLDCKCEDGECNNGIYGDGLCARDNPCRSSVSPCGNNSQCIYTGPGKYRCAFHDSNARDGAECADINPCQNNSGGCHVTTDCVYLGPNQHKCQCKDAYEGDPNKGCTIKNTCQSSICGPNGVCETTAPYSYRCSCNEGYTWVGKKCERNKTTETVIDLITDQPDVSTKHPQIKETVIDLITDQPDVSTKHPQIKPKFAMDLLKDKPDFITQHLIKANCTFIKEGETNCTCPEFMEVDGTTCRRRTIAEEIMEHPKLASLIRIMKAASDSNNILDVVNSNYTFFAPDLRAFKKKFKKNKKSLEYWSREENALSFLKFHTIKHSFSIDDLMASDGVKSYPTLYDGYSLHIENIKQNLHIYSRYSKPAVIKRANISAVNGYIHIINQVLVPFMPDSQEPSVKTLLSSNPKYKLFYKALQKTNVLETLSSLKEYTLFVFPNEVVQHMMRGITADFLKYHILPQRVSTNAMLNQTVKDTILGSRYRLSMQSLRSKIYVNGVAITSSNMWTDKGVVHEVSEFLRPVNNRCDLNISGTALKRECCGGYFGPACDRCPGGPEEPCSGHGVCDDGVSGSGTCKCNPGFSGELCGIFGGAVVVIPSTCE